MTENPLKSFSHEPEPDSLPVERDRKLEYVREFKELINQNPGAIRMFKELQAESEEIFEKEASRRRYPPHDLVLVEEGMKVHPYHRTGDNRPAYYEVDLADRKFFVKTINGYRGDKNGQGFEEYKGMELAEEKLSGLEGVRVADFQLGYQESETGNTYFVSKWIDGESLRDYVQIVSKGKLDDIEDIAKEDKFNEVVDDDARAELLRVKGVFESVRQRLTEFVDVHSSNMMIDSETGELVVFDVHLRDKVRDSIIQKQPQRMSVPGPDGEVPTDTATA